MITKSDAIKIGKAIVQAVKVEQESKRENAAWFACGTGCKAIDNIWYDVLPIKVKEQFEHNRENFYTACDWPQ